MSYFVKKYFQPKYIYQYKTMKTHHQKYHINKYIFVFIHSNNILKKKFFFAFLDHSLLSDPLKVHCTVRCLTAFVKSYLMSWPWLARIYFEINRQNLSSHLELVILEIVNFLLLICQNKKQNIDYILLFSEITS